MTEDEALRKGRQTAEDARKKVGGGNKNDLLKELEKQSEQKDVAEAFRVAGMLWLQSHQETKH